MLHIKQKIYGLMFVLISIIVPLLSGDATISLITLPLGLWFLFTNEQIPELEGRCEKLKRQQKLRLKDRKSQKTRLLRN